YYKPQAAAGKSKLSREYHTLRMGDEETSQSYFGRFAVLRSKLASHEVLFPDDDAILHLVRNLSPDYKQQKGILLALKGLTMHGVEEVVRDAHGELEIQREEERKNGAGHAFVASGMGRGDARVQIGSRGSGGRSRNGRYSRSNGHQGDHDFKLCNLHTQSNHTDGQCVYRHGPPQQQYGQQQQDNRGGRGWGGF
ncbi:unnamed protein product, partial [Pylaiella littoralis]